MNFSQIFTLPHAYEEQINTPTLPSITVKWFFLSRCAVGCIQMSIGWEGKKKKETDMRIGETLSTVLDTSDLQLKVAALYFLTNTPTPVKPLLVSKIFFVLQCCVSFCCTAKCICHALPLSPPSQPLSHPSRP